MHLAFAKLYHILTNISIVMLRLCRSDVMPISTVKLLLRSSEVKCSAYRAEGTLHARSALHLQSILHVPLAEHLVEKALACASAFFWWGKVDSNHRSQRQQIYSLPPLAAREFPHIKLFSRLLELVKGVEPPTY